MSDNSTKANLIAKTLFILGGIILFIVLVIFIFRMVPIVISNIASVGSSITTGVRNLIPGSDETIAVTTDSDSVNVDTPVVVSFEYVPQVTGQYFVSYDCVDGLFFDIQSSNGARRIICNTPFKLGTNVASIALVPTFTKSNAFADTKLKIEYKDAKNNTVGFGTKTITIKSEGGSIVATSTSSNPFDANGNLSDSTVTTTVIKKPTTTTAQPKPTYTPTPTYTKPTKDLVLTKVTGDSRSTFVINVYNYGNTSTGPWEFSYTDAENPSKTVISPLQASLGAGQGMAVTVRFDGQDNSSQTINVNVDPYNQISETNESNNSGSTVIYGNSSNSNNNNNDDSYNSNDDADLVITNMEVGRISGSRFTEDSEISDNDTAAVRFTVKNQGGESTGSWKFEITNAPYNSSNDSYRSKTYSSLRPGETIEVVVEFDGIDQGRYSIKTEVDSDNNVREEKENNNTWSESLRVTN